ncbi:uncharacterized protein KIAA0895 isoform X5 [Carcharodon carcharias]|uniref:uncharacterized protein KIAA0895 isoform X5 n=1 Tax=Carcharodon carcharias TaxID=13397 RepID=UPI001B7F54D0|nr:uncharacterized protein KIAA0895 isoform X5 [Carcharodon carcharias]
MGWSTALIEYLLVLREFEKLRWPELELAKKSVLLNPTERNDTGQADLQQVSVGILKEIFTGSNGYNVLLSSKGEKKRLSSNHHKKHRKSAKPSAVMRYKERRTPSSSVPLVDKEWCLGSGHTALLMGSLVASGSKFPLGISVVGSGIGLSQRPKGKIRRLYFSSLQRSSLPVGQGKDSEGTTRRLCILTAVKPSNVEKEKVKFFKSEFTYNPQFEYANPALPNVLARHSIASEKFLLQAIKIMKIALQKYGSYEKFEQATGGSLLTKSRIWFYVKKYMEREDCLGDIAVHLTDDLLSRASMTIVNGRPTLTINVSTAREHWLEGMLRHEIGCFSKDQVYLDGILKILRHRDNIDFQLLTALGKVSYEDVDRLKVIAILQNAQIPHFMRNQGRYLEQLDKIMEVNGLTDCELQVLV